MPTDAVLTRAAKLRAAGASWESVAAQLGRTVETVLKWPDDERWPALLAEAEKRLAVEVSAEAVLILRQLLRAEDEKVRRDAARFLLELRFRLAAPPDTPDPLPAPRSADARRLVAFLESHSDDDLARLAADMHHPAAPDPDLQGGPESRAGAD
jgi:hypothetical protein